MIGDRFVNIMFYTLPCDHEYTILTSDVKYFCWFFNGQPTPNGLDINRVCSELSNKNALIPCLRFDFCRKLAYRFLNSIPLSTTVFWYRNKKIECTNTKVEIYFLLRLFRAPRSDAWKYTSPTTMITSTSSTNSRNITQRSRQRSTRSRIRRSHKENLENIHPNT